MISAMRRWLGFIPQERSHWRRNLLLAAVLLVGLTSTGSAGPLDPQPEPADGIVLSGTVASKISYQGRLTDTSGNPLSGNYNLVFQVWNAVAAGSQVGSNIVKNGVAVSSGLFTLEVDIPQSAFNGQALWLQIQVNGQTLSPRQELLPVPYAFSLVPGATIQGALSGTASLVSVTNTNSGSGRGVSGKAADIGVFGWAVNSDGHGVSGYTSGSTASAIYGRSDGASGYGGEFWGTGAEGRGVYGYATGSSGIGVKGMAPGANGHAIEGWAIGAHGVGLWAKGAEYAADLSGKVVVRSYSTGNVVLEMGEGLDYAEGFDVCGDAEAAPGAVLVIDSANPGSLTLSTQPYDTRVAGIVSGANGLGSAIRVGGEQFDRDVALAGRVYCNVDATEAAVEPGDLLTTSATPGYAMKVADYTRSQGAILGKAMQPLPKGAKGQILVLVTLQ